jgi:hypothetical protein
MELHELLEQVRDRETFVLFVKALIADRRRADAELKENPEKHRWTNVLGWENGTVVAYLDAAVQCFEDGKHLQDNPETASWRLFADFLYGGKIYE